MNAIDYFFEHSKQSDNIFLKNKKEQISYKNLYEKTIKLANFINNKYGKGNKIVLCSLNSQFSIIAYLAIIKSENVCVPINPTSSESTITHIFKEINPCLIFSQKRFKNKFENKNIDVINEATLEEQLSKINFLDYKSNPDFNSNTVAEIIYTSGSTSLPKGVMISHKNLIANTSSIVEYLHITDKDTMLVVLPFHYCYGLSLLHTHLRAGASIALNNSFMLLGSVINDLNNYECTGFAGVPSHFQRLMRTSDSFKNTKFEHLRYFTQAGGKLPTAFIEEYMNYFPDVLFYVMYGQTEATARLSYLPPKNLKNKLGSIGIAIPGVELKLLDSEGKEVAEGEIGEIAAKGDNIMIGYLNDPETTSKTIVDGYLITGDLATKDKDGYFYLTARKKEIIKVGGERVSPKEIENVIVSIENIIDCTVEGVEDEILGEKLKATVIIAKGADNSILEKEILNVCKQKLSPIKTPQIIEFTDEHKLSASGKKVKSL